MAAARGAAGRRSSLAGQAGDSLGDPDQRGRRGALVHHDRAWLGHPWEPSLDLLGHDLTDGAIAGRGCSGGHSDQVLAHCVVRHGAFDREEDEDDDHIERAKNVMLKSSVSTNKNEIKLLKDKIRELQNKLDDLKSE